MARMLQIVVVIITLLSCVGCDQGAKAIAKEHVHKNEVVSFFYDTFRIQYAENIGSFLSIGSSLPENARFMLFTLGIGAILLGLLGYLLFGPVLTRTTAVSLSLITGGGLSNLADRIVNGGYVIDFLNIGVGSLRTGIFNIADVAIVVGGIVFVVNSLKSERKMRV